MFLGIDLGTSAVKVVLADLEQIVVAECSRPLSVARPHPLWSEQDPRDWWRAVCEILDELRRTSPAALGAIAGIGLSGQMHAAVLLDADDRPLRPAILWNDGRAVLEANELARRYPHLAEITGVVPMPGFTAPKLLWLSRHEPHHFAATRTILLAKDFVRLQLTGERATEMSDASGTSWLDEAARAWSAEALDASGLRLGQMPRLIEGNGVSGVLKAELAQRWGMAGNVVVAGGAGDAAAGAIGLGAIEDRAAILSLGTSGQVFVTTDAYRPATATLVHAYCHALPGRWLQMAALLNGASCLAWAADLFGCEVATLIAAAETKVRPGNIVFLPYLSGERTPHNDPHARGVFFGLTADADRGALALAVLEGVAYAFADGLAAVAAAGTSVEGLGFVGGGARSLLWTRILADVLDRPLVRYRGADKGPAFGAARLARLAATGERPDSICTLPPVADATEPDPSSVAAYGPRLARFRRLYGALRPEFLPLEN